MIIETAPDFDKTYAKLPAEVRQATVERRLLFLENPYHPTLKTHKLSGNLKGYWAFSVKYHYRILFRFSSDRKTAYFIDIGTHDVYD